MADPFFFLPVLTPTLAEVIAWTGATVSEGVDLNVVIESVGPLDRASPRSLAFFENSKYAVDLANTRALACLVHPKYADKVPKSTVALLTREPYRAFALVLGKLYPSALRPVSSFGASGVSPGVSIHPSARLEKDVTVDPGAVIGPGAEIGSGTFIGANSVIGAGVRIGRDCSIGPHVSILNALLGNRVVLLSGARIGQDGFGFAMGAQGHLKVPQIGRVILQDDVEVGANTTIDRGANRDTIIGEGSKIDNLVQIGHNVVIGRHCVITGQVGIAGSSQLDDFVVIGGQAGIAGHLKIGMGAQIAASSGVMTDVPPGARFGGLPAQPLKEFFKELAFIRKFVAESSPSTPKRPEGAI
jgi:UDP-3-O-[3-hydroxymyristoyl] glucosamine N-acyltransferase